MLYTRNRPAKLSHAELFASMWEAEKSRPNRFTIFTELDFLPTLAGNWLLTDIVEDRGAGLLACNYCTRHPETRQLIRHQRAAGGWFLVIDKEKVRGDIDFSGRPDPCNQLPEQLADRKVGTLLLAGRDAYPLHYGIDYEMGTHLFWSRHLHDDPRLCVSGFSLGDIQQKHDKAVNAWVRKQPPGFRFLLEKRSMSSVSASFSESTESTAI